VLAPSVSPLTCAPFVADPKFGAKWIVMFLVSPASRFLTRKRTIP
jgi:hypothetical protein